MSGAQPGQVPVWRAALLCRCWPALTIPLGLALMRPAKAFLVAQQYRTRPEQMEPEQMEPERMGS